METKDQFHEVGVVGLGLMGSSIVTALVIAGHKVVAVAPMPEDLVRAPKRISHFLEGCVKNGFASGNISFYQDNLLFTDQYEDLRNCGLVLECVTENLEIKKSVFQKIEKWISRDAILTTNTSAIPITILKDCVTHPDRFLGMHWAEPAFTTRFLEIICSDVTDIRKAELLYETAARWGKEPTLVRKDIRGFITNRMMYAMFREAFFLVENGYATVEDVDRACRNDGGQWMPFCGLFRYMDLTGLQAYYHVIKDLFPTLNNQTAVPKLISDIAESGGTGISNGKGFYNYTKEEAEEWEKAFEEFSFDISRLSAKYPIDLIQKRLLEKEKN